MATYIDQPGVPLGELAYNVDGVHLYCNACNANQILPVSDVIARLNARGLDGARIGIVELKRYVRGKCATCGATDWHTRPSWSVGDPSGPLSSPHGFVVPTR